MLCYGNPQSAISSTLRSCSSKTGRDNGLGRALGGSPTHIVWTKKNAKTVRHYAGIYSCTALGSIARRGMVQRGFCPS